MAQTGVETSAFRRLTSVDGLPSDIIYGVVQDHEGFMWIGTQAGIARFDGHEVRVFEHNPNDKSTLADSNAGILAVSPDGNLWIGTWGGGLDEFDLKQQTFLHHGHDPNNLEGLGSDRVQALKVSSDNKHLWIGTFDGGLNAFDFETRTFSRYLSGNERVWSIEEDDQGKLWMGTDEGLVCMDILSGKFETIVVTHEDQPTPSVTSTLISPQGTILCGTMGGVRIYDRATQTTTNYEMGIPNQASLIVRNLAIDSQGTFWVATYGQGLIATPTGAKQSIVYRSRARDIESLSHDRVECIYEDSGNVLWVGTSGGGLNLLNLHSKPFIHVFKDEESENSLAHNDISSFVEQSDSLWVGTFGGGLSRFRNGQWSNFVHDPDNPQSLSDNTLRAIDVDSSGSLWVATYRGGVNRLDVDSELFVRYVHRPEDPQSPSSNTMRALTVDTQDRVWIGTDRGLDVYDREIDGFIHINQDGNPFGGAGVSHQRVLALEEDSQGQIWVGTERGLILLNKNGSHRKTFFAGDMESGSLSHDRVFGILSDDQQRIWVATAYGLSLFDADRSAFTSYFNMSRAHDSVNNQILALVDDLQGKIWLCTPAGLFRFDPDDASFRGYDTKDGLQGLTFNQGACFRDQNGLIYVGGSNGFNRFDPAQISDHQFVPPVVITQIDVGMQTHIAPLTTHDMGTIEMDWHEREIRFQYASLDYAYPLRNRYAIFLEGYHDDWVEVGNQFSAPFMNLGPGTYRFKVKGSNRDGRWNPQPTSVEFTIVPPYWQTVWFISLCVLFALAVVFWRIWDVRNRTILLERTVNERTQSLEEANQELKKSTLDLQEAQERLVFSAHRAGMAEIATGVLHNIGNLLNSVNVSSQELEKSLRGSKLQSLKKVNDLLRGTDGSLVELVSQHPKGEAMLRFYLELERVLDEEKQGLVEEIEQLTSKVKLMGEVIATQQSYAKTPMFTESVNIRRLLDDALKLEQAALDRDHVMVFKEYDEVPDCMLPRVKLMQMFTNLVKNAREAMIHVDVNLTRKRLRISVFHESDNAVIIEIEDNGAGIDQNLQELIFNYGYSTKQGGHGFGLHATAIAIGEIGGKISVESTPGKGSLFRLELPVNSERTNLGKKS